MLETLMMCTEATLVEFQPEAKTPESHAKSWERYSKYSMAKNVKEAFDLGINTSDFLYDYHQGFIKIVGGPLRDSPPTTNESNTKVGAFTFRCWQNRELQKNGPSPTPLGQRRRSGGHGSIIPTPVRAPVPAPVPP